MSEQMNKVVVEILRVWSSCMVLQKGTPEDAVRETIDYIGKAILSGESKELDEMLGVVGRGEFVRDSLGLIISSWNKPPTEPLATKEPWHRFIALRREED